MGIEFDTILKQLKGAGEMYKDNPLIDNPLTRMQRMGFLPDGIQ